MIKHPLLFMLLLSSLFSCAPEAVESSNDSGVTVEKSTFESAIEVVGDVEAQKQVFLAPFYSAKLEKINEDGSSAKKNEVVAQLESKDIEDDLNDQELELEVAKNDLSEHLKNMTADQIKWRASVQEAQKVLAQKQLEFQITLRGAKPEALIKIALSRDLSRKAYEDAKTELTQQESLFKRGLASQLEVLGSRLNLARKNRDYQLTLAEYKITRDGATLLDKELSRLSLAKARNTVTIQRNEQTSEAKIAQLKAQKLKAKLKSIAQKTKRLKEKFKRATIRAPLAGTVVISKIWTNKGLTRVKVGDEIRKGRPFLSIANLNEIVVRTEVGEQYIRQLKIGLPCTIEVPSLEKTYQGKISEVGVFAKDRSGRGSTTGLNKVFEVAVLPTEKTTGFKPGTTVNVKIPLVKKEATIVLSRDLIYKRGTDNYVVLSDGSERIVELGAMNSKSVVIKKGLTVGEQIEKPKPEDNL